MANFAALMKVFNIFGFIVLMLALGCNKQRPVACFVVPEEPLEINEPIKFKDCSENSSEYEYEFGDGNFSNEPSPEHTYTYEGNFKISLKVTGDNGKDELVRHVDLVKIPLVNLAAGQYEGTYNEVYPASPTLNLTYKGTVDLREKSLKELTILMAQGSFDSRAIGTNQSFTFTEISNLSPDRIANFTSVSGSFISSSGVLTFTMNGTDPKNEDLVWQIRFSGTKK